MRLKPTVRLLPRLCLLARWVSTAEQLSPAHLSCLCYSCCVQPCPAPYLRAVEGMGWGTFSRSLTEHCCCKRRQLDETVISRASSLHICEQVSVCWLPPTLLISDTMDPSSINSSFAHRLVSFAEHP